MCWWKYLLATENLENVVPEKGSNASFQTKILYFHQQRPPQRPYICENLEELGV